MLTFIVNPNSGGERGFQAWKTAERYLVKNDVPYRVFLTTGPGDATRLAREIAADSPEATIVAVGGDGTMSEVLNGLDMEQDPVIGYIPTGSGNDLARGVGLKNHVIKCLERILERKEVLTLDYGVLSFGGDTVTDRRFAVSCGIGYDSAVCDAIYASNARRILSKIKMQKAAYTSIGAIEILRTKPSSGYIILDEDRRVDFDDIIFISSQIHVTEGGGKPFTPTADPQDGELTLCVMHTKSTAHFVKLLFNGLKGTHLKYPGVETYNCRKLKVHVDTPMSLHADGETFGKHNDIEVRCVPGKFRIIV